MNIEYGDGMLCCHWCGTDGIPDVGFLVGQRFVRCRTCGTATARCATIEHAKDVWNRTQKALAASDEGVVHELSVLRAKVVMFRDYLIADRNAADARVREQVQDLTSRLAADCLTLVLNRGLEMGLFPMRDLVPEPYVPYIKQLIVERRGRVMPSGGEIIRGADITGREPFVDPLPCRIFPKKGDDDGRT